MCVCVCVCVLCAGDRVYFEFVPLRVLGPVLSISFHVGGWESVWQEWVSERRSSEARCQHTQPLSPYTQYITLAGVVWDGGEGGVWW